MAALQQAARTLIAPDRSKGARGLRAVAGFAARAGVYRSTVNDWINS